MADDIVISATAKVIDQASGPLKAISGVIKQVSDTAKNTGGVFADMGGVVKNAFGGVAGTFKQAGSAVLNFGKVVGQVAAPVAGLTGLIGLGGMTAAVSDFAQSAKELTNVSRQLGVTTDFLQVIREVTGSAEQADSALGGLRKALVDVSKGGKAASETAALLGKMGVNAELLKRGKLEEILPLIAAGFAKQGDEQLKARAAMELFGRSWKEGMLLMSKGVVDVEAFSKTMADFKTGDAVAAGNQLAYSMKDLGDAVAGVRNIIAVELLPVFKPIIEGITNFINANRELVKMVALPAFIASLAGAFVALGVAIAGALGPWGLLVAAIVAAGVAIWQNWDAIVDFFGNLPGILADAAKGLYEWFTNIDWLGLAQKAVMLLIDGFKLYINTHLAIGQWVYDQVTGVDWAGLGKSIVDGIAAAWQSGFDFLAWLRGLDWREVGQQAGQFLGDAFMAALRAFAQVHVWAAEAAQAIATALANVNWGEVLVSVGQITVKIAAVFASLPATIAKLLLDVAAEVGRFFAMLIITMAQIGADLIKGLIDGMMKAIPGLSAVTSAVKGALGGAKDWVGGLFSGTPKAGNDNAPAGADRQSLLRTPGARAAVDVNSEFKVGLQPGMRIVSAEQQVSGGNGTTTTKNVGPSMEPSRMAG